MLMVSLLVVGARGVRLSLFDHPFVLSLSKHERELS
jgi:hypothetical protein